MAAPSFVAFSETEIYDPSGTIDIPGAGDGVSAGQRALLVIGTIPAEVSSAPTGWTLVGDTSESPTDSGGRLYVYTAVIGDVSAVDPGATVSIDFNADTQACVGIVVYEASDVDDSTFEGGGGAQDTITTPTATASDAARVVHIHGVHAGSTVQTQWSPSGATTERVDNTGEHGSARNATFCIADETTGAPGTTTARTAVPTETTDTGDSRVFRGAGVVVLNVSVTRPVADAGPDQNVLAGATVNLDGEATDGGGTGSPYTYQWTQTSGTSVTLNDDTAEDPSFTAPSVTDTLVFELVVTDDGDIESLADSVTINVTGPENTAAPVADETVTDWTTEPSEDDVWEVTSDSSDSTYAVSEESPADHQLRVKLAPFTAPDPSDLVVLNVRAAHVDASSGSITISLIEGTGPGTVIATTTESLSGTVNQYQLTLTSTEIGNISDSNDLYADVLVSAS